MPSEVLEMDVCVDQRFDRDFDVYRRKDRIKNENRYIEINHEHKRNSQRDKELHEKEKSKRHREVKDKRKGVSRKEKRYLTVAKYRSEDKERNVSPVIIRRKDEHRNSPIELVVSGCRNTDSSSSSSSYESDNEENLKGSSSHSLRNKQKSGDLAPPKRKKISVERSNKGDEYQAKNRDSDHSDISPKHGHKYKEKRKYSDRNRQRHNSRRRRLELDRPVKQEPNSDEEERKKNDQKRMNKREHKSGNPFRSEKSDHDWGKSDTKKPTTTNTTATTKDKDKNGKGKQHPDFALSGKLVTETNTYNGIVINYNEPEEARKPKRRWRLYPFKGDMALPFIPIHRQSAYLLGRSRLVADIPIDHPSCSKQHAVLQFRLVDYEREDKTVGKRVRPYIIDLESANGTFVNNKQIETRCYTELLEKDVIKFGFSTREYVLLHEDTKDETLDDDIVESS